MGPAPFSIRVAEDGDQVRVSATGELDLATAPQMEEVVLPIVRGGRHAVLDLRGLEFMDSTGVRVLIAAHQEAGEHGGRLTLVRGPAGTPVQRVLEISGLDAVFEIVDAG